MRLHKTAVLIAIAVSVPLSVHGQESVAKQTAQRYVEEGRTELTAGHTMAAEVAFRRAIKKDPEDPYAHYLLANLLVRTGKHDEARRLYLRTLELDPGTSLTAYSTQALKAYGRPRLKSQPRVSMPSVLSVSPDDPSSSAPTVPPIPDIPYPVASPPMVSRPAYSGARAVRSQRTSIREYSESKQPGGVSMSGGLSVYGSSGASTLRVPLQPAQPAVLPSLSAPLGSEEVNGALSKIDEGATFEKNRKQNYASNLGRTTLKGGDWKANDIKAVAEQEIAIFHSGKNEQSARDYLRRQAEARAKAEQEMAKERYVAHQEWADSKQKEIDEAANNLKDQLTKKSSPYGVDLVPNGTSLYVRNYKASSNKKKLVDPHFSVVRFVDRGMEDDVSTPKP